MNGKGLDVLLDQRQARRLLEGYLRSGRIANAYLFAGPEGVGKRLAARLFAQALNCSSSEAPCRECDSCAAIEGHRHPDVLLFSPERGSLTIGIDQVRSLKNAVSLRSAMGGYKVAIVAEADRMTQEAANALLKTLEEPPEKTTLILTTSQSDSLPRTIFSRCQRVPFGLLRLETLQSVLMEQEGMKGPDARLWALLSGGRLGVALRECHSGQFKLRESALLCIMKILRREDSPITVAEAMADLASQAQDSHKREAQEEVKHLKDEHPEVEVSGMEERIEAGAQARYRAWLEELLDSFNAWFRDALVYSQGATSLLINGDHEEDIREIAAHLPKKSLFEVLDVGFTVRERLAANVQLRLLFERLFLQIAGSMSHG